MAKPKSTQGTVALPKRDDEKKVVIATEQPPESYDARALAGFTRALTPERALRDASTRAAGDTYMDDRSIAYKDRYGTDVAREPEYNKPPKHEKAQKPEAAQKGATTGVYRVPVQDDVVQ